MKKRSIARFGRLPIKPHQAMVYYGLDGKYRLTLTIYGVPANPNGLLGAGFRTVKRNRDIWKSYVYRACEHLIPKNGPLGKARISITRHGSKMMDFDGLVGSMKPIVDGLQQVKIKDQVCWPGIIKADNWETVGVWEVNQAKSPRGEESVTIMVQEL